MIAQEVPVNRLAVNQLALGWLKKAPDAPMDPRAVYVVQLAQWGLAEDVVSVRLPIAPSQPTKAALEALVGRLTLETGPEKTQAAMEYLLSNPGRNRQENLSLLMRTIRDADSPAQAARLAVETIYDLMVATSS